MVMDRHNNFDAFRLVAAVSVIFSHAFLLGEGTQDPEPLMRLTGGQTVLGVVGVFVFFTISGFLVTQSFETTGSPVRFAAKRALRIYPGLFVCLLVSAFVMGPALTDLTPATYFRDSATYAYITSNLSMVMPTNALPGLRFSGYDFGTVVDGPLWTLPCEVAMYLMLFALGILRWLDLRLMLALVAVGMGCLWFDTASSDYFIGAAGWLLPFFAAGMAFYRLRDKGFFQSRIALCALAGMALSIPLHAFVLLFPIFGSYLIIYLALDKRLPIINATRFGDLSYGLYIYGWPVEQVVVRLNGGPMAWHKLFLIALPISAAIAYLSWHIVEASALRLKPKNVKSRDTQPSALELPSR